MTNAEEWRPVVGFEGAYEVSSLGRVRSLDRIVRTSGLNGAATRLHRGKLLKPVLRPDGYTQHSMAGKTKLTHLIVLGAFIGPVPLNCEGCHGAGGQRDNRLANLRYDTHLANCSDRRAAGNDVAGERNGQAKIRAEDVLAIRRLCGMAKQKDIAARYNVAQGHISRINLGKRWRHV